MCFIQFSAFCRVFCACVLAMTVVLTSDACLQSWQINIGQACHMHVPTSCGYEASSSVHMTSLSLTDKLQNRVSACFTIDGWLIWDR